MNFKIGDEIIALMDHESGNGYKIHEGNKYIIRDITSCSCGMLCVNVGIGNIPTVRTICPCGLIHGLGIWWINSIRFIKNNKGKSVDVTAFMDIFSNQTIETND